MYMSERDDVFMFSDVDKMILESRGNGEIVESATCQLVDVVSRQTNIAQVNLPLMCAEYTNWMWHSLCGTRWLIPVSATRLA